MKLFGSPGSPFVRKVRAFAAEKGIALDYVVDRPSAPGSRVAELNPLGKIPVLILADGEAVYDSVVIVEYLEGIGSGPRLVPEDFTGRIAVRRWEALGDGIAEAAINISHDYGPMIDLDKRATWVPRQQAKIERALALIESTLAGRQWLHGTNVSLADLAVGAGLFYLDQVMADLAWRGRFPLAAAYAERLAGMPAFKSTASVG